MSGMGFAARLAKAVAGFVGTALACMALAYAAAVATGTASTAAGLSNPWAVTVDRPSRTLFPGIDATMPYKVENSSASPQVLHGTGVQFKTDGVGVYDTNTNRFVDDCLAGWFRVGTNTVATGVELGPGSTVSGTVVIAFEDRPVSQDACRNVGVEVVVTAD
jgi:hypothetical protein